MTSTLDAETSALRRRYLSTLPEQLARLTGAICVAHDGGETAEAHALASRIASTARTHGLPLLVAA